MMNPILQQFANRPTALQHVAEQSPFQQQNPLELLVAALSGLHHRPVDPGMGPRHRPPPVLPLHHPQPGSSLEDAHHGELSIDLSPHHQEIGPGGGSQFTEPQQPGLPPVPFGASGINYAPPIRRRPELAQAFYGTSVHPVGMV